MIFVFDMQGTLYPKTDELDQKEKELGGDETVDPSDFFTPLAKKEIELISNLKSKKFIATGGSEIWTIKALKHLGILHLFEPENIFTNFNKEIDANWVHLSSATKAHEENVYFVGDTIKFDLLPAKRFGMRPVWINRHKETCADAVYECTSLSEALEFLNSIQKQ